MSNIPDQRVQTPRTLKEFGKAMSTHLPARLLLLRRLGKATRALPRGKPRR